MDDLERMADAWLNQHSVDVWPEDFPAPPWLVLRMRLLVDGRLLPTNDRDRAALAALAEQAATPGIGGRAIAEEVQRIVDEWPKPLQAPACSTCGGRGAIWNDGGWPTRCPPAPDGCGGTGRGGA